MFIMIVLTIIVLSLLIVCQYIGFGGFGVSGLTPTIVVQSGVLKKTNIIMLVIVIACYLA